MRIDVRDAGARGDGVALDGPVLQKAVDRCAAAGGGTVHMPAGRYLSGTLRLASGVHLELATGAAIQASTEAEHFPILRPTPFGNKPGNIRALLVAEACAGITVSGPGKLDGDGEVAPTWQEAQALSFRPGLVFFRDCRDVRVTDVTLENTRFWTFHMLRCVDVTIRGVTIRCNVTMPNSDGIDPDGCRNVTISDCNIRTGDDAICLKSTEGDPCENVLVTNCVVSSQCAALKLGTEGMGPIRNVLFNNCVVRDSNVGLALYVKDGATFENVVFSNVVAEVANPVPVLLDITPRYYDEPRVGRIRNVTFDNVSVRGPGRCLIEGRPESPVENVTFRNLDWRVTGPCGWETAEKPNGAARIRLDPARVNHVRVPYHIVAAHAAGVAVEGFRLHPDTAGHPLDRGLVYLKHARNVRVRDLEHGTLPEGTPAQRVD